MTARPLPSVQVLRESVIIDPATGAMTWRVRPASHFRCAADAATWNGQFPGQPAFTTMIRGYLHGIINGQRCKAHRVAYALYTGRQPVGEIDHIDGVKTNNAELNLREVSSAENKRNLATPATNTSGFVGVSFRSDRQKWRAYITVAGRQRALGYFESAADAHSARLAAQAQLGFHPNHGRPACK